MAQDPPRPGPNQQASAEKRRGPGARRRQISRHESHLDGKREVTDRFVGDLYRLQERRARNPGALKDADAREALRVASMVFVQLAGGHVTIWSGGS